MDTKPHFIWDIGTAYDFFISLDVLHDPQRYGLRGNWAAGVRSRIPTEQREFLQEANEKYHIWSLPWLISLPFPKDSASVIARLDEIAPELRLKAITECYMPDTIKVVLYAVAEKGSWNEADKTSLYQLYTEMYRKELKKKRVPESDVINTLNLWSNPGDFGEKWLDALRIYYDVFFHEEEARILAVLEQSAEAAQSKIETLPLDELLNDLSQGLRFDYEGVENMKELIMVPSFWTTPLTYFGPNGKDPERWIFMYGARPDSVSLVPGEMVPDLLYNTLKAMADPTRLRILRYLSEEPLTPAELARRLRLRPPTVIHHLDALRLARLVHVTLSYQGRRYEARREAIESTCAQLEMFLNGKLE